jgi:N-acetylglucosamine-6-phosphate deacetylase
VTVLHGATVVTPDGVLPAGWVSLTGSTITAIGEGKPPRGEPLVDLGGGWLLPGYIDLHFHGGGGHDVTVSPDDLAGAVAYHRSRGTTRTVVSLVTGPIDALCEQLGWVADLADQGPGPAGHVVGAHLEGPFLAPERCGAQHPDHMLRPEPGSVDRLLAAGRGRLRTVTIAPELPGALAAIDRLVAAGVVAAVGHTGATYDQARAAFERGASLVTHLFNAMPSLHHRHPGPVPAAFDAGANCEIINDGLHVHPAAVRLVDPEHLVLITDAIDATGSGDGEYQLGGRRVRVADGQARLVDTGALAGSTLTMDRAVRRAVLDVGLPIVAASAAASGNPARVLGIADRCGAIAPGLDADLVLLDDELRVTRVMAQGAWI